MPTNPGQDVDPNIPIPPPVDKPTAPQDAERSAAPLTLDAIRSNVATQLAEARTNLEQQRTKRDQANARVKVALAEVEELERVHNQLKPRPPTQRKPKTTAGKPQ